MTVDSYPGAIKVERASESPALRRNPTLYAHIAVAITCLLLSMAVVHRTAGKIPDDAFIMLRYAQNLLDGRGWIYNLHHPTANAVSAPLYTLTLALLGLISGSVEQAATLFFVFTTAASGYFAFAILRRNSMTLGGLAAMCLMIVNPWLLATQGLETSTFVCLLLLSVLLNGAHRYAALGFALVAATLVRGDGAVLAVVFFVVLWQRARRFPWRFVTGAGVAAALWAIIALIVNIPLIPDTLDAKIAQGRSGLWGDMLYLRGSLVTPKVFGFLEWAAVSALLAGVGLFLVGGLYGLRRYLGPFVLGVLLIVAAYGLIIRPPTYHWYYGPQLALMALCGGVTISVVARAAAENVVRQNAGDRTSTPTRRLVPHLSTSRRAAAAAIAVTIVMTATASAVGWRDIIRGVDRPAYLETAAWLRETTPRDATVALAEIGIVGWYSRREMVDFLGLLSKESVHEIGNQDAISWLSREEPDYWVIHQPQWPGMEAAASESWFSLAYIPAWTDTNHKVVAWKHFRSIVQAKRLVTKVIQPEADHICDQLEVSQSDGVTRKAITALLALFSVRKDLRNNYMIGRWLDLEGLVSWAASPAINNDLYGAAIQLFRSAFEKVEPHAKGLEVDASPLIE